MVVIKKRQSVIPVDFGEFQLEFSVTDENIKKIQDFGKELDGHAQKIVENQDQSDLDKVKDILVLAFDGIFGPGSFEKVYEFSGRSTINTLNYYFEAMNGIEEEQVSAGNQELLKKYLTK